MIALTKQAKDGRTIEIRVSIDLGQATATATIDGTYLGAVTEVRELPKPIGPGITHGVGRAAITAAEAATVTEALRQVQADYDASPEGRQRKLRLQRERLATEVHSAHAAASDARGRAHDTGEWDYHYGTKRRAELAARIDEAEQVLAAFDAEHPEVLEQLRAEEDEQVRRHMWD